MDNSHVRLKRMCVLYRQALMKVPTLGLAMQY
jgi:hypothetical protein